MFNHSYKNTNKIVCCSADLRDVFVSFFMHTSYDVMFLSYI